MSTEAIEPPVIVERRGALGVMTLNRPRAINALTHEMVNTIQRALDCWSGDPEITTVVVRGTGDRGLCAGGDIVSIYQDALSGGTGSEQFWRDEYRLNAVIASYPKPYVALMDGLVLGGGVGISAHARHRVVTDRTKIGMPETGIGFVPDVGGTWLLSRAPGELGTYLALTAGHVAAADAIELGLADYYVPATDLGTLVDLLVDHPVEAAIAKVRHDPPPSILAAHRSWIDECFGQASFPEILGALAARGEREAADARRTLVVKSPTSQAVTLQALRAARHMSHLEEALAQEYRISMRMLRSHDLAEGIRAQVIGKDRKPQWKPAEFAAIDPADIDSYFASLGEAELDLNSPTPTAAPEPRMQEGTP